MGRIEGLCSQFAVILADVPAPLSPGGGGPLFLAIAAASGALLLAGAFVVRRRLKSRGDDRSDD